MVRRHLGEEGRDHFVLLRLVEHRQPVDDGVGEVVGDARVRNAHGGEPAASDRVASCPHGGVELLLRGAEGGERLQGTRGALKCGLKRLVRAGARKEQNLRLGGRQDPARLGRLKRALSAVFFHEREAAAEDVEGEALDRLAPRLVHRVGGRLERALELDLHEAVRDLGVEHERRQAILVCNGFEAAPVGGRLEPAGRFGGEIALDELVRRCLVEGAHEKERHVLRRVPALVEGLRALDGRRADHVDETDRIAVARSASFVAKGLERPVDACAHAFPQAPLLDDDLAFTLEGLGPERDVEGPFAHDVQSRVEPRAGGLGDGEPVGGAAERRDGVDVRAEHDAVGLKRLEGALVGEVTRAVEGHVLDVVCKPALLLSLLKAARAHDEAHFEAARRIPARIKEHRHAVGQNTALHGGCRRKHAFAHGRLAAGGFGAARAVRGGAARHDEKRLAHGRGQQCGAQACPDFVHARSPRS